MGRREQILEVLARKPEATIQEIAIEIGASYAVVGVGLSKLYKSGEAQRRRRRKVAEPPRSPPTPRGSRTTATPRRREEPATVISLGQSLWAALYRVARRGGGRVHVGEDGVPFFDVRVRLERS